MTTVTMLRQIRDRLEDCCYAGSENERWWFGFAARQLGNVILSTSRAIAMRRARLGLPDPDYTAEPAPLTPAASVPVSSDSPATGTAGKAPLDSANGGASMGKP